MRLFCFFFNDTATTEIYTLSLHDALPISALAPIYLEPAPPADWSGVAVRDCLLRARSKAGVIARWRGDLLFTQDRKSTRLNSSHANISYAVFCLKKKKKTPSPINTSHLTS